MNKKIEIKDIKERKDYLKGIGRFIDGLSKTAEEKRDCFLELDKTKQRDVFKKMLGYPLNDYPIIGDIASKTEFLIETDKYTAEKYQLELFPDFWFYGILYTPKKVFDKNALIIAQHGGGGTPEILGSLVMDSANYNHMVNRVIGDGVMVFAPQLLLWNSEIYGTNYDRVNLNKRLIQLGGSITALEVFCIMRCIDYFCQKPNIDANRIGMIGLSYGGMYTLYTAAADERIKAAYSSCWFSDRAKYNWHDWVYFNQENCLFDAEIASLILPRKLYIEVAKNDEVFLVADADKEIARLVKIANKYGCAASLKTDVFEGVHELNKKDGLLIEFLSAINI